MTFVYFMGFSDFKPVRKRRRVIKNTQLVAKPKTTRVKEQEVIESKDIELTWSEGTLKEEVVKYLEQLRKTFPDKVLLYKCDLSGTNIGAFKGAEAKKQGNTKGWPDLTIDMPSRGYHGLRIELKKITESPYKKNGELKQNEHTQYQSVVLELMEQQGYKAVFGVGYKNVIDIINEYFGLQ